MDDLDLGGLHHVTAITGDAPANLAFYTRILGMRLVKRTVNQDDVRAYHLFYGDRLGNPGTELTFFDWPASATYWPGAGTIGPIGLRVGGRGALEWWLARLEQHGVAHEGISSMPGGYARLPFADPEGQRLALVASEAVATGHDGAAGDGVPASVRGGAEEPWHAAGIPQENAVHGLADVTLTSLEPSETLALLTEVLGFRWISPDGEAAGNLLECGPGGLGAQVRVMGPGAEGVGRPGVGGVHHVAFRTPDAEQQEAWRERILHAGVPVTKVIDRFYFRSIYFREPGGGLFEIATDGPGFTQDEDVSTLGERLSLPPFLEPRRQEIEAALRPLEASV